MKTYLEFHNAATYSNGGNMVEEIFGKDELNKAIENMRNHVAIVKLTLTTEKI